jgi:hypothetical protein
MASVVCAALATTAGNLALQMASAVCAAIEFSSDPAYGGGF